MNNKSILADVMSANPELTSADLAEITGRAERTIQYWLSEDTRAPENHDLYLIFIALSKSYREASNELTTLYINFTRHANRWATKHKLTDKKIGQSKAGPKLYLYDGEYLSIPEIAKKTNKNKGTIAMKVQGSFDEGEDVTIIVNKIRKRSEFQYLYHGDKLTVDEIAKKTNKNKLTLKNNIYGIVEPGADVTEIVGFIGTRRNRKYIYKNQHLTTSKIAELSGKSYSSLRKICRKDNIGEDVTNLVENIRTLKRNKS